MAFEPMTYQEAMDIRISSPSTPLTTGDALRTSCRISSRASPAPACRMRGIIGREPPWSCGEGVRVRSLTREGAVPNLLLRFAHQDMSHGIQIAALGCLVGALGCVQID